ncbi:phage tail protein [Clostridium botulinum]|uniref:phage tail-collar fiber domain-containing protein n=1 Tax=Clostridium botulinum TaxID=1491 RepID=UPI00249F50A2|nr:phage tail protein [Clostridium botulinum]MDU4596432.1 phage tail protein [Clostridium sporogenes]WGZ48070.1 hypothetical protein HEQ52_18145 [Clostridium botulinum]
MENTKKVTSITTDKVRKKLARAHVDATPIPRIIQAGWGTGGVDEEGNVLSPETTLTKVPGELIRNNIKSAALSEDGLGAIFIAELMPGEEGVLYQKISSVGLYDEEGDLVLVKNFTPKQMDSDSKITIECTEEF